MHSGVRIYQTVALSQQDVIVSADVVSKEGNFHCPDCKGLMILRRGKVRIPHFAHKKLTPNCTPETVLHKIGKNIVKEIIESYISSEKQLRVEHNCSECSDVHRYNVVKGIVGAVLEKSLDTVRPDVSLLDGLERPQVVIEVVVTHAPDEKALAVYKETGVVLIQVHLRDFSDLDNIEYRIQNPINSHLFGCHNLPNQFKAPKAPKFKSRMFIFAYPCANCRKNTQIALIDVQENFFEIIEPNEFSELQLDIARKEGVIIGWHKFSRNGDSYLVNKCAHCGMFPGEGSHSVNLHSYYFEYSNNLKGVKVIEV